VGAKHSGVTPLCDDGGMATTPTNPALVISCETCCMRDTATCADCVVTHVLSPPSVEPISFDDEEVRVVRLLVRAGMVPTLRHSETDAVIAFR
jgi:hypothetical protein